MPYPIMSLTQVTADCSPDNPVVLAAMVIGALVSGYYVARIWQSVPSLPLKVALVAAALGGSALLTRVAQALAVLLQQSVLAGERVNISCVGHPPLMWNAAATALSATLLSFLFSRWLANEVWMWSAGRAVARGEKIHAVQKAASDSLRVGFDDHVQRAQESLAGLQWGELQPRYERAKQETKKAGRQLSDATRAFTTAKSALQAIGPTPQTQREAEAERALIEAVELLAAEVTSAAFDYHSATAWERAHLHALSALNKKTES